MNLPIDEIIENGITFNFFGDTPMDNIRGEVRALFAALRSTKVDLYWSAALRCFPMSRYGIPKMLISL